MTRYLLVTVTVALLAGCQTIGLDAPKSLSDKLPALTKEGRDQAARKAVPTRIVAIWSDAVYSQAGTTPVRGFGGRIYFYNDKHEAVPVEGQLIVYGFDDTVADNPNKTPSRKFVFTEEQIASRHSVTELGDSYSVWLPWDEVTGFKKTVTLMPMFVPNDGQIVMGPQTVNLLPGKARPESEADRAGARISSRSPGGSQAVRPVSYETQFGPGGWQIASEATDPTSADAPRMKTTTIKLPPSMTQRMALEAMAGQSGESAEPGSFPLPRDASASGLQSMGDGATTVELQGQPAAQTSARFERPRYQAPKGASWQRGPGLAPSPPGLAAPQFGPASRP
ncbi:MAG: hypothetical protein KJ000_34735 [Pirellulaceae bacterium]|nr:hypothetical protein [Pirellulaceae bacterium]